MSQSQPTTTDWDLRYPDTLDINRLAGRSWVQAMKATETRIQTIANANYAIREYEDMLINMEKDFISDAIKLFEGLEKFNSDMIQDEKNSKSILEQNLKVHAPEKNAKEEEVAEAKKRVEEIEAELESNAQIIVEQSNKKKVIAEKLNIEDIINLKVNNKKGKINELFKWIWATVYEKPLTIYDYNVLKKEAFQRESWLDFILRIKTFDFVKAKPENMEQTKKLLEIEEEIYEEIEKKDVNNTVRNIFAFVEVVDEVCTAIDTIKKKKEEHEIARLELEKKTTELNKVTNAVDGLQGKLGVMNKYVQSLDEIHPLFGKCIESLKQRIQIQTDYQRDLENKVNMVQTLISEAPKTIEEINEDIALIPNPRDTKNVLSEPTVKEDFNTTNPLHKLNNENKEGAESKIPGADSTTNSIKVKEPPLNSTAEIQQVEVKPPPSCECNIF